MPILVGFLAEVKLLWRRQAGQLGHKLQTGDDGHKPPHQTSGVSIITPKVNIPSSFDVQFGRVSFVERDAGRRGQCFVLHALSMQGSPMRSFCRRCRVLEQWQMCLPLLSGEQIKCSH